MPPLYLQMVKDNEKPRALEQELAQMGDEQRIIVFANTKSQVRVRVCGGWV
jgi:superfamily II DNA/RNA helicase